VHADHVFVQLHGWGGEADVAAVGRKPHLPAAAATVAARDQMGLVLAVRHSNKLWQEDALAGTMPYHSQCSWLAT
jgi:hypothetical protein